MHNLWRKWIISSQCRHSACLSSAGFYYVLKYAIKLQNYVHYVAFLVTMMLSSEKLWIYLELVTKMVKMDQIRVTLCLTPGQNSSHWLPDFGQEIGNDLFKLCVNA